MRLRSSPPIIALVVGVAVFLLAWRFGSGEFGGSRVLPAPGEVIAAYRSEWANGRLARDSLASLFRIFAGFGIAVVLAVPIGLALGSTAFLRIASAPFLNFFRNLSPIAWIPFAVFWFGIGDAPVVFLLAFATFFPLVHGIGASVMGIPPIFRQMSREDGIGFPSYSFRTVLPAILPEILVLFRLTFGVAWTVLVAAEMLAGREGLGFAVMDARNGLRTDLLVANMIQIGLIGVAFDLLFVRLLRWKRLRWKYG